MGDDREALADQVLSAYGQVFRAVQAVSDPLWIELDLSMAQLKGLVALRSGGPMTISHFAEVLGVGKPAASMLADGLVRHGLADRADDAVDRRRTLVRLSPRGEDLVVRLRQGGRDRLRAWLAQLDEEDLAALARGLAALAAVGGDPDCGTAAEREPVSLSEGRGRG